MGGVTMPRKEVIMSIIYQKKDAANHLEIENSVTSIVYRQPNRRKCYWLCKGCLKHHEHGCSTKCPDYLSVAQAKAMIKERMEARFVIK